MIHLNHLVPAITFNLFLNFKKTQLSKFKNCGNQCEIFFNQIVIWKVLRFVILIVAVQYEYVAHETLADFLASCEQFCQCLASITRMNMRADWNPLLKPKGQLISDYFNFLQKNCLDVVKTLLKFGQKSSWELRIRSPLYFQ